jgi:hypothetical protein
LRAELTNCVNPPLPICPTNKTVFCGSSWNFDPPNVSGLCCGTNAITILGTTTNGSACAQTIARSWLITCGSSVTCTQTVTIVPLPSRLAISRAGTTISISWTNNGTLETATNLLGPWSSLLTNTSPYTITNDTATRARFYRLRLTP